MATKQDTDRLANFRDVGGLPTSDGRTTKSAVLFRSDAPQHGDAGPDVDGWPPALVIDMRSPGEIGDTHPLARAGTHLLSISLAREAGVEALAEHHMDLATLYAEILEHRGDLIVEAVAAIARADGAVLVHCAAGKDRTGIVVAAALAAVGVRREAIVADYHRTEANMHAVVRRFGLQDCAVDRLAAIAATRPQLLAAPEQAIETVLDTFAEAGSAKAWLRDRGADDATLDRLAERLTQSWPAATRFVSRRPAV